MQPSAAREIVGPRKPGAWKRLAILALLASVLACTSGCASHNWMFGTTRWVTQSDEDVYSRNADHPPIVLLVPCLAFDFVVLPVTVIHDSWPHAGGTGARD